MELFINLLFKFFILHILQIVCCHYLVACKSFVKICCHVAADNHVCVRYFFNFLSYKSNRSNCYTHYNNTYYGELYNRTPTSPTKPNTVVIKDFILSIKVFVAVSGSVKNLVNTIPDELTS